jgi:hypothetical protein
MNKDLLWSMGIVLMVMVAGLSFIALILITRL